MTKTKYKIVTPVLTQTVAWMPGGRNVINPAMDFRQEHVPMIVSGEKTQAICNDPSGKYSPSRIARLHMYADGNLFGTAHVSSREGISIDIKNRTISLSNREIVDHLVLQNFLQKTWFDDLDMFFSDWESYGLDVFHGAVIGWVIGGSGGYNTFVPVPTSSSSEVEQ